MDVALKNHYDNLAKNYNTHYRILTQACAPGFVDMLELKPDDRLLDFGSATGLLPDLLRNTVGLKYPVTCVEPCERFLPELYKLDGMDIVSKTAESFCEELSRTVESGVKVPFNKVLINGTIHHFSNPKFCLDKIVDFLPKDGILVISYRRMDRYVTQEHAASINKSPDEWTDQFLPHLTSRQDIDIHQQNLLCPCKITKRRYLDMIRGRYMSFFKDYTDAELDEYVETLEKEQFGGVGIDDDIDIPNNYIIFKCTKRF